MATTTEVEALTWDYGREIFTRLERDRPFLFSPAWIDDRMMQWGMGDESVKVQLFRFVDVLPMLTSPQAIARHLQEYFDEAGEQIPRWMRFAVHRLPQKGALGRLLAWIVHRSTERLARKFIAGSNIPEALEAVDRLRQRSLAFTVDLLGEATITEVEADKAQQEYLTLIADLSREVNALPTIPLIDQDDQGPIPRGNVSVKLSALYSQFDAIDPNGTSRAVRERLRPLLRAAKENHAFVNFDMESYEDKDMTIRIFKDILEESEFRQWPDCGIAIQAYLKDCPADLKDLARWVEQRGAPITVRLVKGAYWDYETIVATEHRWPVPVFSHKSETDACYESMTRFLMERCDLLRPAIGSHNIRSVAHGLALAHHLNVPKGRHEIQMLYGMADPIKEALVSLGQRVRVYTPYGELIPGMAYLVRRLLENTSDDSFLRASFTENVPEAQLLMNPKDKIPSNGAVNPVLEIPGLRNEPFTDFTKEASRQAMEKALNQVREQLGQEHPLIIDGQAIQSGEVIPSINPSHKNQIVGKWHQATADHARQALDVAERAFPSWRSASAKERAEYLFKAADVLRRRKFELAAWQNFECAKDWREADADIAESIDFCEHYGHEMIRLSEPRHRDVAGEENQYFYEPRGITVVLAPWNFPLAILCGMTTAALVAGCPVIMKPAEQSSIMGAKLMEVFQEVGIPNGVVSYLPGIGEEIGPVLVKDPRVAVISFTGSRAVGLQINKQAAEMAEGQQHVKRVLAEMGGKNAIIVDDDADLDEAVQMVKESAFGFQGQKCSACSRAIVLEGIYDRFVPRLVEATRSMKVGPAEDPGNAVGPVIDEEAQQRILKTIEEAKGEHELLFEADLGALSEEGFYVPPVIFGNVDPGSRLAQEEIFGPVLAVIRARDLDHALEIANGTPYALTGGISSRSPDNIERIKRELRVGNLYINRKITGALVDRQPFGGFKLSGIGAKAGGPDYLLQFLIPRTITESTMRRGFAPGITS